MNETVFLIQRFPLAIVSNLTLSLLSLFLIYTALIHISFTIQSKKLRGFFVPLSIFMVLNILYAFSTIEHRQQKRIVIYHVFKNSLIDCFEGETCFSFMKKQSDNLVIKNRLKYAAENHRIELKIKEIHQFCFDDTLKTSFLNYHRGLCQFDSFRLLVVDKAIKQPFLLPVNVVLICNNPRLTIEDLYQKVQFQEIIFDASNNRSNVDKWKIVCINLKIPFYDIEESGAWMRDLKAK